VCKIAGILVTGKTLCEGRESIRYRLSDLLRRRVKILVLLALISLGMAPQGASQPVAAPEPADDISAADRLALDLARLQNHRQLVEASLTPLKSYISSLYLLEKQRSESRDYAAAIAARDERQRMESELDRLAKELLLMESRERSLKAEQLPDVIVLAMDNAELQGVSRDPGTGALTQWQKPGATATWNLPGLPPGGYEVVLVYECGALEGGSLLIKERTFSLTTDITTTLRGPTEFNIGTLKITDGGGQLVLTARTVVRDNLMKLRELKLIPASR
jgi:hypothetical protein